MRGKEGYGKVLDYNLMKKLEIFLIIVFFMIVLWGVQWMFHGFP